MGKALDKRLGLYVNVAALVSLIASVLTIYFFVGALNRNAMRTDTQLLEAGLVTAADTNETWVADYAWWDELGMILGFEDTNFLSMALASSFDDHDGYDFIVLTDEASDRTYSWHRDSGRKVLSSLLTPEDLVEIRADLGQAHEERRYLSSHFLELDERYYLVSATVIGQFEDRTVTDAASDPILIIGSELDKGFFGGFEQQYLVDDIRFIPGNVALIEGAVAIRDGAGHTVGQIVWTPSTPGLQTLRLALIPLLVYIIAFLIASQVIGWHARKLARKADENEQRARKAAATDSLSQLPNRHGFVEFIDSDTARTAAARGEAALIYVDLNGFKAVNDKAGHHAGDAVIRIVAQRFRETLPADVLVARMGGDEFACVLIGADQTLMALDIARDLSAAVESPVEFEGRAFDIGAAIGVAWSETDDVKTFDQLIEEADLAMYRAKAEQLTDPLCFDTTLGDEHAKRRDIEAEIEYGIANGEFSVVYQPIVDAHTHEIVSAEALLRWNHPERGSIPPDVFIPIAERSKLIQSLGDLVVDAVCRDIGPDAPYSVSINLSPRQLGELDLCPRFVRKLTKAGMSPSQVHFELTEAVLVDDFDRAKARMAELSEAGFRINLDDFGTGFAGVGYLHALPFNKIKLDKSFVRGIGKGEDHTKLLQAMSLLGDALDLAIVAEGVETDSQASMLRLLGFDYFQGWHFGRPMSAETLRSFSAPPAASSSAQASRKAG